MQWGGNATWSEATGNPTSVKFPRNIGAAGGIPDGASAGTASPPQYAVSLPAPVGDGQGGAGASGAGTNGVPSDYNTKPAGGVGYHLGVTNE